MVTGTMERLADLCGHRNVLDAQLVQLVAEALDTGEWQMSGIVSPAHWLSWKAGLSTSHARQLVALARRRADLPVTFAAFDAGQLSLDQVAAIVAKAPCWADAELCEFATLATVTQLRRVMRSFDFAPDPVPEDDPPPWLRDLISCDTILSPVFEQGGIPVSVGRSQRTVPERTRRLVILRDRGCRVPGCAADRVLHIHHVIHWDPDHGAGGPPPQPANHYQHPVGERLQMHWVTFNPPPPPTPTPANTN